MLNSRMIDLYPFASDQDTGLGDPFLIRRRRVKVVTLYTVRTDVSEYPLPPARAAGDLPKEWNFFPGSLVHLPFYDCLPKSLTFSKTVWVSCICYWSNLISGSQKKFNLG